MSTWEWNGARWWKCDFHMHTPASYDFTNRDSISAADLVARVRAAELDAVAITDHNTGQFIEAIKEASAAEGRELTVFAGVELTVNPGIHLLVLFPPDCDGDAVTALLGKCDVPDDQRGRREALAPCTFEQAIEWADKRGAICIAAHVDDAKGLLKELVTVTASPDGDQYTGSQTLKQALKSRHLAGVEANIGNQDLLAFIDGSKADYRRPFGHLPILTFSDAHSLDEIGERFTWLKMTEPTSEGLRLALLDGALSVRRSEDQEGNPNRHAALVLESIEVSNARYMGRACPFNLRMNPWLNAIIGGRGTGKSSLVEFLRLALRRDEELPDELRLEFEKYAKVYSSREDGGLLTHETAVRVVYRKNGSRFRVQWSPSGDLDPIEEQTDGAWRRAEGDVVQRFPIRIYSQKQIFHLAKTPMALLKVVDEAPEVDRRSWNTRWKEEESRFLSLRAKAREIEAGLSEEPGLKGELDDVKRKMAIFEEAGHADVLKSFQKRQRQQRAVESWEEGWTDTGERLREIASEVVPDALDDASLDMESEEDANLREIAAAARDQLDAIRQALEKLADQADGILSKWKAGRDQSAWKEAVDAAVQAYHSLRDRIAEEGAGDPSAYGELVLRRQAIERRLKELRDRKNQVTSLRQQAGASMEKLLGIRRALTEARRSFLQAVLKENDYVRIEVVPYGARETVEAEFRRLIQREGAGFEKDIGSPDDGGLLGDLYAHLDNPTRFEERLLQLKDELREVASGTFDPSLVQHKFFANHLQKLRPEALDRLETWVPEDSLAVQYSPTGDGRNLRSIEEGSPGQKTAALLAFLLSYGDEPLVLDQPEDDLDNHLIYELIVTQLRGVKRNRQILVVTHNPNIVVNGDAELVVALVARNGETHKECEGSLQEKKVRDTICEVMEGGRDAFEQRYRRIALEARHV